MAAPDARGTRAGPPPAGAKVVIRPPRGRAVGIASWAHAAVVLVVLWLIRWVGDAWWGTTFLLFMPRWLFLLPLLVLAPAAGISRCFRHWVVQTAAALVVAGPLMQASLPLPRLFESRPPGDLIRVATFNLGTEQVDFPALNRWLTSQRVDVICFQEGRLRLQKVFPELLGPGWFLNRERTIASRFPIIAELEPLKDESTSEGRYAAVLERARLRLASGREIAVASAHLPTIRPGFERLLARDIQGLVLHVAWWGREMGRVLSMLAQASDVPMVVGGDFNMPSDDSTMAALRTSFRFAFEEAGWGYGYTRPAFHPWMRIDHLLTSPEWYVTRCQVGPDLGSDHLPLVADVLLPRVAEPAREGPAREGKASPP